MPFLLELFLPVNQTLSFCTHSACVSIKRLHKLLIVSMPAIPVIVHELDSILKRKCIEIIFVNTFLLYLSICCLLPIIKKDTGENPMSYD